MESLLSGAIAGTTVDCLLFPLDTIKTRLQSKAGFLSTGGFKGIYSGLSSALMGSAPSAASFFITYESIKSLVKSETDLSPLWTHMLAASCGEINACFVRVPADLVKQRLQTGLYGSLWDACGSIYSQKGLFGFYQGFQMTLFREIPFTCIQFPLYEALKQFYTRQWDMESNPWYSGLCGCIAGGIAAAATTPLDVVKTRIMLDSSPLVPIYFIQLYSFSWYRNLPYPV